MKTLRSMERLRWWIAAWFLLSMGVAMASPIVQPRAMELICSGSGAVKVLIHSADGGVANDAADMDCALCLLQAAPPEPLQARPPTLPPLAQAPLHQAHHRIPAAMAAPPPARAPPFPKCLNQERST